MDVIISDYELPKSCYDCNLHNYHYCDVTGSCIEQNWDECTKAEDCPLKEVPSGKWVKEDRGHVEYTAVCSVCGETEFWSERSKYCPSCGSLMVDEQQGEQE